MKRSGRMAAFLLAVLVMVGGRTHAQDACVGDCNDNYVVAINELIVCVNIALGNSDVNACPSCDPNDDAMVAINELIQAVNAALDGCPAAETPTPEATDTPGGPTATATSTPTATEPEPTATAVADIENVAGASAAIANAVSSVPNLVGAVLAGVKAAQAAGAAVSGIPGGGAGVDPCELGGTVAQGGNFPNLSLTLDNCRVSRPGGSVAFDGTLAVNITNLLQLSGTALFNALITFFDESQEVLTETSADLSSNVRLAVQGAPTDPCAIDVPVLNEVRINRVDLTNQTGTLDSLVSGEGASNVTWMGTDVSIAVNGLSQDCVPIDFDVTVNGDAEIERQSNSAVGAVPSGGVLAIVFGVTFEDLVVSATGDGISSQLDISGKITSSCVGQTVTLSTPESLSFLLGQFCPSGGTINVQDIGDIVYSPQGVTVAGMSFASCSDPALLECVQ